jgi:demethylmenaquinone methyltransferase/2-methoxy-6-polyprenyl-1,4-benzoquinol methylase
LEGELRTNTIMHGAPDPLKAVAKYRARAQGYDASARRTWALRRRVVGMLDLRPGQTVLDVACGTGLSLPLLREAVGASGRVLGVEVSPEMMARARARVAQEGWRNVELIEAAAEDARLDASLDAVLFNYTHDVLQSPRALQNLLSFARPGARVALAGIKHPRGLLYPLRLYRLLKARPYVTTFRGLDRPWALLARHVPDLRVEPVMLGTNYLACGSLAGSVSRAAT